jgi:hypothetical protein
MSSSHKTTAMKSNAYQTLWGISLIVAPLLQFVSSFFWKNGEYSVTGGTLLIFSLIFWIAALMGLFSLLQEKTPVYAAWGLLIAIYGCISGVNFGFVGVFTSIMDISHESYLEGFSKYPVTAGLLLFQSGPLFPLSLLVLSIMLIRYKTVPLWVGLLIGLGAIAFPLSRIPRIALLAHLTDLLLLLPLSYLGWTFLRKKNKITDHTAAMINS